ncbi:LamG domain-containing protein [Parabacteroides sp. FAFU027]|uniref:LamG domain-containing protein n=1 Tax=Parabacteroides sp. FAFU027 TaxID=2922715 RepID=UPI001FAEE1D2|nr:LamG domain-containing protein [Parabacteroides sp. FAFU027]
MRKLFLIVNAILLSLCLGKAQDTMYVYQKSGIISKIAISNIDSVKFSSPVPFNINIAVTAFDENLETNAHTSASVSINGIINNLTSQDNLITITSLDTTYTLSITKEGFVGYTKQYSLSDLLKYRKDTLHIELTPDITGLVAYYPFNGNANDESGNLNTGVVKGATLCFDRLGNSNSAYLFNGSSNYITTESAPNLNIQNSFSIALWFKTSDPDVVKDGTSLGMLVSRNGTVYQRSFQVALANSYGMGAGIRSYVFNTNDGYVLAEYPTAAKYYDNKWHNLVSVYNKSTGTVKIYVDKVLINETYIGKVDVEQCSVPLNIGCYSNERGFYSGAIDDVRIYNKALSSFELKYLYTK